MLNHFALRAKHTRDQRKGKAPAIKPVLIPREDDVPMNLQQYFLGHIHLARCWGKNLTEEYSWFVASLRGELPVKRDHSRDFFVHFLFLPREQYFRALEALTTRLGVKLPTQ